MPEIVIVSLPVAAPLFLCLIVLIAFRAVTWDSVIAHGAGIWFLLSFFFLYMAGFYSWSWLGYEEVFATSKQMMITQRMLGIKDSLLFDLEKVGPMRATPMRWYVLLWMPHIGGSAFKGGGITFRYGQTEYAFGRDLDVHEAVEVIGDLSLALKRRGFVPPAVESGPATAQEAILQSSGEDSPVAKSVYPARANESANAVPVSERFDTCGVSAASAAPLRSWAGIKEENGTRIVVKAGRADSYYLLLGLISLLSIAIFLFLLAKGGLLALLGVVFLGVLAYAYVKSPPDLSVGRQEITIRDGSLNVYSKSFLGERTVTFELKRIDRIKAQCESDGRWHNRWYYEEFLGREWTVAIESGGRTCLVGDSIPPVEAQELAFEIRRAAGIPDARS